MLLSTPIYVLHIQNYRNFHTCSISLSIYMSVVFESDCVTVCFIISSHVESICIVVTPFPLCALNQYLMDNKPWKTKTYTAS